MKKTFLLSLLFLGYFLPKTSYSQLTWVQTVWNGAVAPDHTNLRDVWGTYVSPDNLHLYYTTWTSHGLGVYDINPADGTLSNPRWYAGGSFSSAREVIVSPDGNNVYAASSGSDRIYYWDRAANGNLSNQRTYTSTANIDQIRSFAFVSGGDYLYTGSDNGELDAFSRAGNGNLAYITSYPVSSPTTHVVRISSDDAHLYAYGSSTAKISGYSINTGTGALTPLGTLAEEGVGGVDGISYCYDMRLSPDGKHLYTPSNNEDNMGIFSRDAGSGVLTYLGKVQNLSGGVTNMDIPYNVNVSPDGSMVVVQSIGSDALTVFERDPATGLLTWNSDVTNPNGGTNELQDGYGKTAFSPNGLFFYAGGWSDAIAAFGVVPLSVELLNFDGYLNTENQTDLFWETASEKENAFFSVQRSGNGYDFEEIGVIQGNGTSSQKHNYSFLDEEPINGVSYYRLNQVDYDGTETLSKVIVINNSDKCAVAMYQNSFSDELFVLPANCNSNTRQIQINIYDVNGRLIKSVYQNDAQGDIRLDMSAFNSGVYIVSINDGKSVVRHKVFKK